MNRSSALLAIILAGVVLSAQAQEPPASKPLVVRLEPVSCPPCPPCASQPQPQPHPDVVEAYRRGMEALERAAAQVETDSGGDTGRPEVP